jgi:ABC-type transport system involved in multi-copper enzyme maturation permease subunit
MTEQQQPPTIEDLPLPPFPPLPPPPPGLVPQPVPDPMPVNADLAEIHAIQATAMRRKRFGAIRAVGTGMAAVSVKELRGRMRGKRAFVIMTAYLLLIAGFAWMIESLTERTFTSGFGGSFSASAEIGRGMFLAIITLLTIVTLILAPASTAGAISLEREKQTLDLLVTTPISSLAIVLGKLLSALTWIFLLLLASIPIVSLVFTFGGVAPEDVVRAYLVLFVTAIFYGAMGLFISALVKRTQAATIINLVLVIALTAGTTFIFIFWVVMTGNSGVFPDQPRRDEGFFESLTRRPPEALEWWNPFVAQVDVMCGTETGFGGSCQLVAGVTGNEQGFFNDANGDGNVPLRDSYWPRSLAAMAVTALILILASVQLVSPTRRWRIRRGRGRPAPAEGAAA